MSQNNSERDPLLSHGDTESTGSNGTQNAPRPEGPDGYRAWVVAIACFVILFVVGGLGRLFALVFVELIQTFGVNRKSAALPLSIHLAVKNISGPLVGLLSQKIGLRAIIILGAFISAFSVGACYFAESIAIIVILWGLINGIGTSLCTTMIPVRIDQYFRKYKATAMGMSFFGGCCGSLIFPVLLGPVIHNQGIKAYFLASFLIVITFIIPAGLVLKKPAWMRRNFPPFPSVKIVETAATDHRSIPQSQYPNIQRFREYKDLTIKVLKSIIPADEDLERFEHVPVEAWRSLEHHIWPELEKLFDRFQAFVDRGTLVITEKRVSIDQRLSSGSQHQPSLEIGILEAPEDHYADLVMLKLKTMTIKRLKDISTDCIHDNVQHLFRVTAECRKLYRGIIYLNNFEVVTPAVEINTQEENNYPKNSTTRSNFEICKNILFHFVCLSRAAHFFTCISVMTTIVDFMMDKGLKETYGEYAIIALSAGDSIGRIGTGWITDYGWLSVQKFVMFVMLILSLVTFSFPFLPNIPIIFTVLVLFGILQGSLFIRHPILATKYTRPHEHSTAIGLLNFIAGLVSFGIPAYIGAFRDNLGSYDLMFYINAAITAFIAVPWIFEPYFLRYLPTEETPATNRNPEPV